MSQSLLIEMKGFQKLLQRCFQQVHDKNPGTFAKANNEVCSNGMMPLFFQEYNSWRGEQ